MGAAARQSVSRLLAYPKGADCIVHLRVRMTRQIADNLNVSYVQA